MKRAVLLSVLMVFAFSLTANASPRMVLGEDFTNTACVPCAGADPMLNYLVDEYYDVFALVRYHTYWPSDQDPFYLYNVPENEARITLYGVNSVPNLHLDGVDRGYQYNTWENYLLLAMSDASPLEIYLENNWNPDTREANLYASITATDDISSGNLRFYVTYTEDSLYYNGGNGVEDHFQVMRDIVPNPQGESFTIANGETVNFDRIVSIDNEIIEANCVIVVWVQDYVTLEVYQAAKIRADLTTSSVDDGNETVIPRSTKLSQNYPNPFNAQTKIVFGLNNRSDVNLKVYNLLGEEVATLAYGKYDAGLHSVNWNAADQSSGVYFYRLETGEDTITRKMILAK
ncbi:MAG: T9SS type A sorting domain-containing protein [candidate division Zixibacteria bacterium]|nr:T9SS type A sorting domain-containing protein [candidate division Zixibacteria bacterium]